MITIKIEKTELYDEIKEEFIEIPEQTLHLEHSLLSISKWESKWQKPFLVDGNKTEEEILDYMRCMTIERDVDSSVFKACSQDEIDRIHKYISSPMTATIFRKTNNPHNNEQVTSELIYYWMIAEGIPFECQKWHINRLLTLIRVCAIKNTPPKKMSKGSIAKQNAAINAARRKKLGTRG